MSTVSTASIQSEEDLLGPTTVCRTYRLNKSSGRLGDFSEVKRPWQLLSLVLTLIGILLTLALITVSSFLWLEVSKQEKNSTCQGLESVDSGELYKGPPNPFSELSAQEIESVVGYLHAQEFLALTNYDIAKVNSNYIHLVEMLLPPKTDVLRYLNGSGPMPPRMARAFIFKGNTSDPIVEEYVVGPLPRPTTVSLIKTESRKTRIPFSMRPFSKYEFAAMYKHVLPGVLRKAGFLLKESYNATLFDCGKQCLRFSMTPVSSGFLDQGKRKSWFWFAYDIEFYTLHPLDFQFLVDMTDADPTKWLVQRVFYAKTLYSSLDELISKYREGNINKTRIPFPKTATVDQSSAAYMRGNPIPSHDRPPPQQVQPGGPRYTIRGNYVEYMDWKFNMRISTTRGAQLYDIRYRGERILYELSMQDISVLYSGYSPAASMLYFADSAGLFGTRMRGMMPGVDCPAHSTMLDALVYTSNTDGMVKLENSLCVFEHSPDTPLRRHRAYGMSGAFYTALNDYVLVVRMYICIINYDYVFDFIFHNNGAVEVKVSSTGYLATAFYYPEEKDYGTRISDTVVAGLHHHLFHFKADIDVKGTENRFQTWNIGAEKKTNEWADDSTRTHTQNFFTKEDQLTEKNMTTSFHADHTKYLLFYKNKQSELGHTPSYRLIHKGVTKMMLPEGSGFEPSVSWGRHPLVITKYKDEEMTSSSMFAMWDAQDPVVNFKQYFDDDESIVDEDLVAWITLGTYHIPQMENVPNTGTVGTTLSFFLTPFNYFHEDPSLASRDAIKIMPHDVKRPYDGAYVDRHNISLFFDCGSSKIDEKLRHNSSFLFS